MSNNIYVICGGARTFLDCFDTAYNNVISCLFDQPKSTHLLFYLKLTDPGPKGQKGWDFSYPDSIESNILDKIAEIKKLDHISTVHCKILQANEISDHDLFIQVADRKKYFSFLSDDQKLIRALHSHYNFEQCGKIIEKIEKFNQIKFDHFIYMRPDLYFSDKCRQLDPQKITKIILAKGPNIDNNDHFAVIPRQCFRNFFYRRMEFIRTNTEIYIDRSEQIYWTTIRPFEIQNLFHYYIKRA